jgi:hypothetical protein
VSACGVCGQPRRRNSARRVFVLGPKAGEVRAVIACASCARRSVVLAVAPFSSEPERKRVTLDAAERDVRVVLRSFARKLRKLAMVRRDQARAEVEGSPAFCEFMGKVDTYNTAADMAESWASNPSVRQVRNG